MTGSIEFPPSPSERGEGLPEVTELHRQSASGFFCWPMNTIDLCKRDRDLPLAIDALALFIAKWEQKGRLAALTDAGGRK